MNDLIEQLAETLVQKQWKLVTAESCTGGLVAKLCTDMSGSSRWFFGGLVTYDNHAKINWLGVQEVTLLQHGAVSQHTVREMALGALAQSGAQVAVSISGIAGPAGGSPQKPVGTVWIGCALEDTVHTQRFQFEGSRAEVRQQAAQAALRSVLERL